MEHAVERELVVPEPPEEVWRSLTEPEWLGEPAAIDLRPAGGGCARGRGRLVGGGGPPPGGVFLWGAPPRGGRASVGAGGGGGGFLSPPPPPPMPGGRAWRGGGGSQWDDRLSALERQL